MTEARPVVVTFRFETAPIVRGECTLDAVLGGEIARRVDSREQAIGRTPLACTGGVHHGSSLVLLTASPCACSAASSKGHRPPSS